ncbi:hypothetical protein DB41_GG00010, partial [Neochlamydia sp. TUME1]
GKGVDLEYTIKHRRLRDPIVVIHLFQKWTSKLILRREIGVKANS